MVNRLVSVGDDFTLPVAVKAADANLPARLQDAALSATNARLVAVDAHGAVGDGVADDTAAINAAIAALNSSGSRVLAFSGGRNYKTSGGHVLPVGTTVLVNGATITHTGNNTCLSFNQSGGFNIDKPTGIHKLRLIGNSGASAVGVENGNNWGWRIDGDIDGYTNGVGLRMNNKVNWTEGYDINSVKIDDCKVALQFRRDQAGGFSFGYGRIRNLAINVPANGIGIDLGGDSPDDVYLYSSDIEANIWPQGNNAIGVRVGPTVNTDNVRVHIVGEVPSNGSFTGLSGLKSTEGGTFRAYGHFRIKDAPNNVTGACRILAAAPSGADGWTGTDAAAGTFNAWLTSNEDVSHNAMLGHITGSNRSIPFAAGYNQSDIFRFYSVPFGGKPSDVGALKLRVDTGGNLRWGNGETGVLVGSTNPSTGTTASPGTIYLRSAGAIGTAAYIKETGTDATGWKEILLARYGTTAQRPTAESWGMPYFDSTLKRAVWWDGGAAKWVDGQGVATPTYETLGSSTMAVNDRIHIVNGSGATVSLPTAASAVKGREYIVKNKFATAATVNVSGGGNIDGGPTVTLAQWAVLRAVSDGTNWYAV